MRSPLFIAAGCAAFLGAAGYVLWNGHLHEDAYILLKYSRAVAAGEGIVFDAVLGRAEGATDFLWMVTLAALKWSVGGPLGIWVALLNTAGLAVILWVVRALRGTFDAVTLGLWLVVLISGGTAAAIGGFSTLAYCGLFSGMLLAMHRGRVGLFFVLGTLLCLFRPDGVLLFGGSAGVVLARHWSSRPRALLAGFAAALLVGAGYFAWRTSYFGLPLPLPLMVKARTDRLFEGIGPNVLALWWYLPLFALALHGVRAGAQPVRNVVGVLAGALALGIGLSFAYQSQNVGFRFQAPIVVAVVLAAALALPRELPRGRAALLALAIALSLFRGVRTLDFELRFLTSDEYSNSFPQWLALDYPGIESVALTEAGRLPYWYQPRSVVDLIGLNSPDVVREGPRAALEAQRPELILAYHWGMFSFPRPEGAPPFVVVGDSARITLAANGSVNPVRRAPREALRYAVKNGYSAVLVQYDRSDPLYVHAYFLSPRLSTERFVEVLRRSHRERMPYLESVRRLGER